MHVGIDSITPGNAIKPSQRGDGGVRVYLRNLMQRLPMVDPSVRYTLFLSKHGKEFFGDAASKMQEHLCPGVLRNRIARVIYEQTVYPLILRQSDMDVFLSSCNVMPLGIHCPSVVVVHSLQYFFFPASFSLPQLLYLRTVVPASLHKADAIITVSEYTKQHAVERMGIPPEKIHVVYYGIADTFHQAFANRHDPAIDHVVARYTDQSVPYILALSTFFHFKNFERLIRAFAMLKRNMDIPHQLLMVGREANLTRAQLQAVATEAGVKDAVRFTGGAPHEDVIPLLLRATMLSYPSLYETFGIPLIEAMACGCPVLTSTASSLPEVASNAAEIVDPYSEESIAEGMRRILTDHSWREELIERGFARSKMFHWDRTAEQTLSVVRGLSGKKS